MIPFAEALDALRAARGDYPMRDDGLSAAELLHRFHPDSIGGRPVPLAVGVNAGMLCQPEVAALLQTNALIDDVDIAGAETLNTDILVIGGGGAGCAAALTAAGAGARVTLATKLLLGDSNTVMAEGGIQAAVGEDDSPQRHFEDTYAAGHRAADRHLVAQMALDGPDAIRWLIKLGMAFDTVDDRPFGGSLRRKTPGGATAPRILSYRDFTGLEMMRVLREAVALHRGIQVTDRSPAVELLSDDRGRCAGAVLYAIEHHRFVLVRARRTILATGGSGRLHLNGFPTSNHYGATADGVVLAYRLGAKLREMDSFQYHPTGIAHPAHLAGGLISEAARSEGAKLVNGRGERFVDELKPRDVVASAILRECAEGRGIARDGQTGVFLDVPTLVREKPGILETTLVSLAHLAAKCRLDPAAEPLLVYPTLHYQNGGVAIDGDGASAVPGLLCVGEVSGGIHGRNRMMGNALLDIISFGRRAGARAADAVAEPYASRAGIGHIHDWQRKLTLAGLSLDARGPQIFPPYGNFDLAADARLRSRPAVQGGSR
ncbi:L-aspartate oxidase NadB [uncultured Alphaproteobacteria bacterium]|uniref:L-aspartate oxidase NadB n=1 Tax=uncultured Alphaproteobacteria bacterium TaxID=91750 RepID=A0A212KKQ9_9PROT|nr:L-aspartate oxidase NadB [uncultured Alphaproteobacteria bacterium]